MDLKNKDYCITEDGQIIDVKKEFKNIRLINDIYYYKFKEILYFISKDQTLTIINKQGIPFKRCSHNNFIIVSEDTILNSFKYACSDFGIDNTEIIKDIIYNVEKLSTKCIKKLLEENNSLMSDTKAYELKNAKVDTLINNYRNITSLNNFLNKTLKERREAKLWREKNKKRKR